MWKCEFCETNNENNSLHCVVCGKEKGAKPKPFVKPVLIGIAAGVAAALVVVLLLSGSKPEPPVVTNPPVITSTPQPVIPQAPVPTVKPSFTLPPTPAPTPVPTPEPEQHSVYEIFVACGDVENVGLPRDSDVLDEYKTMYVRSGDPAEEDGKKVVYTFCDRYGDYYRVHPVEEGSQVLVLAKGTKTSLCLYEAIDGSDRVGWIWSAWLED